MDRNEAHCQEELKKDSIKKIEKTVQKKDNIALKKMVIVSLICILFMMAEIIGGLLANSLAIITDAAHLFSDLSGFLISIFAIMIGQKPSNKVFTFGYHRAEVLGALTSVITIWILTGFLIKEAIDRIANPAPIDAKIMLITSIFGLMCNLVMMQVLHSDLGGGHGHHGCSHGHSHGHGHNHSHHHDESHISISNEKEKLLPSDKNLKGETNKHQECSDKPKEHIHIVSENREGYSSQELNKTENYHCHQGHINNKNKHDHDQEHSHNCQSNNNVIHNHGHDQHHHHDHKNHDPNIKIHNNENQEIHDHPHCHSHEKKTDGDENKKLSKCNHSHSFPNKGDVTMHAHDHLHNHSVHTHHIDEENVNVTAAIIHIIGDIVQSVGVVIAAVIIYIHPHLTIIDPICTFFFSIIVFFTTVNITKTCINILMESCPEKYQIEKIEVTLRKKFSDIISIHEFHIWTLSTGKYRASLHIVSFNRNLSAEVSKYIKKTFKIEHVTVQIDSPEDDENLLNCLGKK